MVYGLHGQLGQHAQNDVGEEHLQGDDLAIQEFQVVEEKLVLGKVMKIRPAIHNAVVRY